MKIHPAFRLLLPLFGGLILLSTLLLSLPHGTQAAIPPVSEKAASQTVANSEDQPDPRWMALARAAKPAPMPDSESINQAQAAASINVDLLRGYVAGQAPLPTEVTLRLERQGEVLVTDSTMPIPEPGVYYYLFTRDSDWQVCDPYPYYCTTIFPEEGDLLWLEQSGVVFSMTVPYLTALASPEENRVYGETNLGAPVNIYFYPEAEPGQVYTATTVANTDGYSASMLPVDVHRKDGGISQVESAPGRYAYRYFRAPLLGAHVGGAWLYGVAAPRSGVKISFILPGTPDTLIATSEAYTDYEGDFATQAEISSGDHTLSEGLLISVECAAQTISMTVPRLTVSADMTLDRITGETLPGAQLEVLRFDGPISNFAILWEGFPVTQTNLIAAPSGAYTASIPLAPPDYGAVYVNLANGHRAFTHYVTPYLTISLGTFGSTYYPLRPYIRGQLPVYNQPVTVTVQGPSGFLKDWLPGYTNATGYLIINTTQSGLVIDSGDLVTATSPGLSPLVVPVPLFTAQGSLEANQVSGKAPPGSSLRVTVQDGYSYPIYPPVFYGPHASITTTATPEGDYLVDFTGQYTITEWTIALVELWNPDGHILYRLAELPTICTHGITGARIGSSIIEFAPRDSCPEVYLRLLAPDGREKGTAIIPEYIWQSPGVQLLDQQFQPAIIQPGDRLEIDFVGELSYITAPAITAWIDESQQAIIGSAPAGSSVTAILKPGELDLKLREVETTIITGTAGVDGSYLLPVGDPELLTAGLWAEVRLTDTKPAFYVVDVLPLIKTSLYSNQLFGTIRPETAYTLTWQSADGSETIHGLSYWYGHIYEYLFDPVRVVSPGDQISLETSGRFVSMTVPLLNAAVDLPSATVTGKAPPDSPLAVGLGVWGEYYPENPDTTQIVTTTSSGDFNAGFPELAPLTHAQGSLTYRDPNGHITEYDYASPYFEIYINRNCIAGTIPAVQQPFALTHQPLAGATQVITGTAYGENGAFSICLLQAVQSGDQLMLESPVGGTTLTYTVPQLTARHDYAIQAVTGSAPPGVELRITLLPSNYSVVTRRAISRPDGVYGVDTSDLELKLGNSGYVTYYDPAGAIVWRSFTVTGFQHFFPVMPR